MRHFLIGEIFKAKAVAIPVVVDDLTDVRARRCTAQRACQCTNDDRFKREDRAARVSSFDLCFFYSILNLVLDFLGNLRKFLGSSKPVVSDNLSELFNFLKQL